MGDLSQRLAQGDRAALSELYDACADRLHHYLVVMLGSRADADDILQETFVRVARQRGQLVRVANLTAYVFTIARHEALRLAERRKKDRRRTAAAAHLYVEATSDQHAAREMAETLAAALACLSTEQREIVELKTTAGLTLREIAEITGLPPGTVATRYRAAIMRLRHQLGSD